jgi:hypothetical protein
MAELNAEIGLQAKIFKAWDIFGGYRYTKKDNKGHHLLIVKQRNDGEETHGVPVSEFIKNFSDSITELTKAPAGNLAEKITWPPLVEEFVMSFEVYVKEVYLRIESTDGKPPDPDKGIEYAFWIGIQMTPGTRDAIKLVNNDKEPYMLTKEAVEKLETKLKEIIIKDEDKGIDGLYNLREMTDKAYEKEEFPKAFKTKQIIPDSEFKNKRADIMEEAKLDIPPIFKIFQLENLYIKIWQTSREDIKEALQLDLLEKYAKAATPKEITS